ncbi:MAG: solute carrier family 23 protein [Bryobacteraceae bacterium]
MLTGLVVVLLSRVLHRLRALFPPEVVGLIAFMVGASQVSLALSRFLGVSRATDRLDTRYLMVAGVTLALIAGLTVWDRGRVRLFSSVITLVAGHVIANQYGFIKADQWAQVSLARFVDLPRIHPPGLHFNIGLLVPFLALGLSAEGNSGTEFWKIQKESVAFTAPDTVNRKSGDRFGYRGSWHRVRMS